MTDAAATAGVAGSRLSPDRLMVMDEVLAAVEADLQGLVKTAASLIQDRVEGLRSLSSPDDEDAFRGYLHTLLNLLVVLHKERRRMTPAEAQAVEAVGAAAAAFGLSRDEVLNSVVFGVHAVQADVRRKARLINPVDSPEHIIDELLLWLSDLTGEYLASLAAGHDRERGLSERAMHERLADLADDLLLGRVTSLEEAESRGLCVGLDLSRPIGLLVVPAAVPTNPLIQDAAEVLAPLLVRAMPSSEVPHTVMVATMHMPDLKALETVATRHRATFVTVKPRLPHELSGPYREAVVSFRFAASLAPERAIIDSAELLPAHFLATATSTALEGIEREVLLPLRLHEQAAKLVSAFDALVQARGSAKGAARLMGLTERTLLRYKTEIETAIGRTFGDPIDAVWLTTAWAIHRTRHILSANRQPVAKTV